MLAKLVRQLRRLHDGFRQTEQMYIVLVAVAIGLLAGLCSVGFRLLIQTVNSVVWQRGAYTLEYISGLPVWWKILVPAVGGLIVGLITYHFARVARGPGVPEVMEAVALRGGQIRPRVVIAKMLASGICIGTGGSVGREGPIVQIGSALGSTLGQWLGVDQRRLRTLVACGAAGGIAGTFNAPVAGALFAVEIILGDFGVAQFSPIVISAVSATVVSHRFLGDFPAFEVPGYSLMHASELFAYAGLGILAAVVAVVFIRSLYGLEDLFAKSRIDPRLQTVLGGAMIGLIGVFLPHIFGVGYEAINEALNGTLVWQLMALLVIVKIIAVSITIGSGGSGGIFAPSLFIGAMLGGAVGTGVQSFWPTITAGPGAYALVGMGAVVAAATHAPITAILIIFELTGSYPIILPLMISCIIATLISIRLRKESIYTLKLLRRGVDIYRGRAINVLQHVPVREVIRTDVATIAPEEGILNLISRFVDHPGDTLFVANDTRELLGIITANQIRPVMNDPSALAGLIIAEDVMVAGEYPRVTADMSLADIMKFLGGYRGEIPVLENGHLAGVIWAQDVIERYNSEIFKRDMAGSMARAVHPESKVESVSASGDAVVAEVPVPRKFVGRTIRELNIRQAFGVTVLVVKRTGGDGDEQLTTTPDADYVFEAGDVLLVLGSAAQLPHVRSGVPKES